MSVSSSPGPLWTPSAERVRNARMSAFILEANARFGLELSDYRSLYTWSITERADFWRLLWDFCGVRGDPGGLVVRDGDRMPGARWFPDARLNFAENLLRRRDDADALVFWGEDRVRRRLSYRQLYDEVARVARALRAGGVGAGDRVAAVLPNMPETVVAMLATREPRRDLVLVLAGLRRAGRARPLRPDRAEGAVRGRRLLLQRQNPSIAWTSCMASSQRCRRSNASWSCRTRAPIPPSTGLPHAAVCGRLHGELRRPARSSSRGCRSTTRSTSCIRPARPACRSASCTARAARCCSTSRSTCCTPT